MESHKKIISCCNKLTIFCLTSIQADGGNLEFGKKAVPESAAAA